MIKRYLKLEDLNAYRIATELSDYIWEIVVKWDWFAKKTIGAQWTESSDSIADNIAEEFDFIIDKLRKLPKEINALISFTEQKLTI